MQPGNSHCSHAQKHDSSYSAQWSGPSRFGVCAPLCVMLHLQEEASSHCSQRSILIGTFSRKVFPEVQVLTVASTAPRAQLVCKHSSLHRNRSELTLAGPVLAVLKAHIAQSAIESDHNQIKVNCNCRNCRFTPFAFTWPT